MSLTLMTVSPSKCTAILKHTANLVHCKIITFEFLDGPVRLPDTTLPHLESLVFILFREGLAPLRQDLETFNVPALRTLQIPDVFLRPDPILSLNRFIARSGCDLQEVRITGGRCIARDAYRTAFPEIPKFSFVEGLTEYYSAGAELDVE